MGHFTPNGSQPARAHYHSKSDQAAGSHETSSMDIRLPPTLPRAITSRLQPATSPYLGARHT